MGAREARNNFSQLLGQVHFQAAIRILNRSSFAEGLLTEAERAWSGDLRPSQSKLGHNENC
jgi:hypothetical protein